MIIMYKKIDTRVNYGSYLCIKIEFHIYKLTIYKLYKDRISNKLTYIFLIFLNSKTIYLLMLMMYCYSFECYKL
jgi:hypothetical protein